MFKFQEVFDSSVMELLSECETEEEQKKILEDLGESIPDICDEQAESLLETIRTFAKLAGKPE